MTAIEAIELIRNGWKNDEELEALYHATYSMSKADKDIFADTEEQRELFNYYNVLQVKRHRNGSKEEIKK